jgi:hypothetical protein
MKIKSLMKRMIKGKLVLSKINDKYKIACEITLTTKITQIKKTYNDPVKEVRRFYVR